MYKQHSDDYKHDTGISWMTDNSIGPRRDELMVIADAHLKRKHTTHRLITFESYESSETCHPSADKKRPRDTYTFRSAIRKNEMGEYKMGVRVLVVECMLGNKDRHLSKSKTDNDALPN